MMIFEDLVTIFINLLILLELHNYSPIGRICHFVRLHTKDSSF